MRRLSLLALALCGCSDPALFALEIPAGARTLVYAQIEGGAELRVSVFDLESTRSPALRRETEGADSLRAAAIFYAETPGQLRLPIGVVPAASGPPSLPLPAGTIARHESTGASWTARAEMPALLAGFHFSVARECLRFEVIETVLTTDVVALLPIGEGRALAVSQTRDPATQLAVITSTGASFVPGRAVSGTPTAATIEDGEILVGAYDSGTNAVWAGSFDRGLSRVRTSSAFPGEALRYLARDRGARPPRLYGTTSQPALIDLDAEPWRQLWRGDSGLFRGGMEYDHEGGTLLANVLGPNNLQLVLSIHDGTFDEEPAPAPRSISGMGRALGSVWLGMSLGGAFRRSAGAWTPFELQLVGDVRAFFEVPGSMVATTADGHLLQHIEGAGYCPPQRLIDLELYLALRLGDQVLLAGGREGQPNRVLRVRLGS